MTFAEATFNAHLHNLGMPAVGWVGPPGQVSKFKIMAVVQATPPLTPVVAPIYVLDWAQRL